MRQFNIVEGKPRKGAGQSKRLRQRDTLKEDLNFKMTEREGGRQAGIEGKQENEEQLKSKRTTDTGKVGD